MIELKDYFNPVNQEFKKTQYTEGTYGKSCLVNNAFDKKKATKIALLGISETRNSYNGIFDPGTDLIRSYFYKLSEIPRLNVVDLGNLKPGKLVKDTYASVKDVIAELLQQGIIPVIIGGSQDITVPLVRALPNQHNENELTVVDSILDDFDDEFHSNSFLNQLHKEFSKNLLVSVMGYQTYFVPPNKLHLANKKNWNLYRLGTVRNNFNQIEPILRDSDIVSFDISSIRQTDCPAASFLSPNGLYTEEACQLANLSGLSDKLKLFSLFEYQKNLDVNGQSAHLAAQIIWYFMYGVSQRKNDYPNKKLSSYKKIYVKLEKIDFDLVFYENKQNKRFWAEIPTGTNGKSKIISCSEYDYKKACKNEIPDRIWQNISRYLK